jgi:hypothetical protein
VTIRRIAKSGAAGDARLEMIAGLHDTKPLDPQSEHDTMPCRHASRDTGAMVASLVVAVVAGLAACCPSTGFAQPRPAAGDSPKILLRATLDLHQPPFAGAVERITPEGELRIGPYQGKPGKEVPPNGPLAEGLHLGVVRGTWKDLRDAQLVRVDVTEVMDDGMVVAKVGRGLDGMIPRGKLILLVRPPQTTTVQMRSLPDLVTLEEGPAPNMAGSESGADANPEPAATARADRAVRNLAAISRAINCYVNAHQRYPPAALIGPDGKAWHSWRVLILRNSDDPALQEIGVRYSLQEPWDAPGNRQLLDRMPSIFNDDPEGKPADSFTRFAAVTGEGTVFSPKDVSFDPTVKPYRFGRGTHQTDFMDAPAFTLMVGTLPSTAKIPWTKPEDVVVRKPPPPFDSEGFFGTPYELDKKQGPFSLFITADCGLAGICKSIEPNVFHALTTFAGREGGSGGIDISKTPGAFVVPFPSAIGPGAASSSAQTARGRQMTIVIFEDGGETKARASR